MKLRLKFSIFSLLACLQLLAQSNIRFNNFWDNMYTVSPAAINDTYFGELSMGTRKQWLTFPGAPVTMFASGTVYIEDLYTQIGLKVLADKIGYTTKTDVDLSYAYAIYLNTEWQMNLGIAASYQSFHFDYDKVILTNPNEAIPYNNDHNFNTDLGFEFSNFEWRIGGASQNFLTLFRNPNYTPGRFVNSGNGLKISDMHPNTNILYAMYGPTGNTFVNVGGGICGIQTANVLQAEMNVTAFFKRTTETNAFQLGAFYRTWQEMGLLFGIHFDRMRIYYSYDFNVGEIYRNLLGTHEIILTYKLNRTYKCRNCWY